MLNATWRSTDLTKCRASQTWPTSGLAVAPSAFSFTLHHLPMPVLAHRVQLVSLDHPPGHWQKATAQYTAVVAGTIPDVMLLRPPGACNAWKCH